jgi:Reverse transcriptase (RNA-dependent DNA polymerase)
MGFTKPPRDMQSCFATNLSLWMKFGYFPNGLPPAFSTANYAHHINEIIKSWSSDCGGRPVKGNKHPSLKLQLNKREASRPTSYSFPKRIHNHSRREGFLTHPVHQTYLTEELCNSWVQIKAHIDKSELSLSKPIHDHKPHNPRHKRKRYLEKVKLHKDLDDYKIDYSACNRYALYIDLQGFYPSIYTHSLEWALVGKEHIKKNRTFGRSVPNPILHGLGKSLDSLLRNTKEGETKGIPIGPDTSFVIAEIIATEIDRELASVLDSYPVQYQGYRHVDDMVFYIADRKDADTIISVLREILNDYHLTMNETKTHIVELPEAYKAQWTSELSNFPLTPQFEQLRQFFTKAFALQKQEPSSYVLRYALQILRPFKNKRNLANVELQPSQQREWNLLEAALAQAMMLRPDNIVFVHDILVWYRKAGFSISHFDRALANFISHTPNQHDFEIAWGLWLVQTFQIKLDKFVGAKISQTSSPIVKLMALDLHHQGLIEGLDLIKWEQKLAKEPSENEDDWLVRLFYQSDWILAYEACMEGWLGLNKSIVEKDCYLKELAQRGIRFFTTKRTLSDVEIETGLSYLGVGGMAGVTAY